MRRYSQGNKVPLVYENSVNNRPKKKIREFYLNQTEELFLLLEVILKTKDSKYIKMTY